jgi:hypothetical protein
MIRNVIPGPIFVKAILIDLSKTPSFAQLLRQAQISHEVPLLKRLRATISAILKILDVFLRLHEVPLFKP